MSVCIGTVYWVSVSIKPNIEYADLLFIVILSGLT
jgi:hypothetical protein